MTTLNSKAQRVALVINFPKGRNQDKLLRRLEDYLSSNFSEYYYILHDKDIDIFGELKTPHIHVLAIYKDHKRLSTFLNGFSDGLNVDTQLISIDKWVMYENAIQYLIHKNDKDKFQYLPTDIHTNMSEKELNSLLTREIEREITIEYLMDLVRVLNGNTWRIYSVLGLDNARRYRNIIQDLMKSYWRE